MRRRGDPDMARPRLFSDRKITTEEKCSDYFSRATFENNSGGRIDHANRVPPAILNSALYRLPRRIAGPLGAHSDPPLRQFRVKTPPSQNVRISVQIQIVGFGLISTSAIDGG